MRHDKWLAEFFGTGFLILIVVGSGIMAEALSPANAGVALLANSLATGAGLFVLIENLGGVSGAHLNPVVSLVEFLWGRLRKRDFVGYCIAQFLGALLGVFGAHLIFDQPLLQLSIRDRLGSGFVSPGVSEMVATFGLIATISLAGKRKVEFAPLTIAAYVTCAYWFTSSTAFANPAVTVARMFTETFCGIAPAGVPVFVGAQLLGALLAFQLLKRIQ